jgi:pilus assembly protein CpaE
LNQTILVTPDAGFQAQVKRAFDGDLDADRWWDARFPNLEPDAAARLIAHMQPSVVVVGPDVPTPTALALAVSFDLLFPEVCVVLVAKPTTRLWERALRAGVREIIPEDAEDSVVRDALTRAGAAAARRQVSSGIAALREEAPRGRVITVMAPKGGAGKTTVATNLATQLAAEAPGRVAIVDLDLQFGDVASALGLGPQSTIADASRLGSLLDSTALKVFLEPHPSGLYALVGPHFPAEAEEISVGVAGHIIDILAAEFAYVVIDTGAGLDEFALAAIERADDLVLVCVTDVPSVRGMRKALDAIDLLGMTKSRRHLVLNRSDDKVGLAASDVEATVGLPVEASVPTSRAIQISINQGAPIVGSDPRSPAGRALAGLAHGFVEAAPATAPAAAPATVPVARARRFSRKDGK